MRKLLAMLLALMLLIPGAGLADTPSQWFDLAWENGHTLTTEVSFEVGNLPVDQEVMAIIKDVAGALGFRAAFNKYGMMQFAAQLQKKDALALNLEMNGGTLYVQSDAIYDQIMAYDEQDMKTALLWLVDLIGKESGMSQSEIDEIEKALTDLLEGNVEAIMPVTSVPEIDFSGVMAAVMKHASALENAAVTEQPANCDPAAEYIRLTITPEMAYDVLDALCKAVLASPEAMEMIKNNNMTLELDGKRVPVEEFLKQVPAKVSEYMKESLHIQFTAMANAEGEIVYADLMAMNPRTSAYILNLIYTRQTIDGVQEHLVSVMERKDRGTGFKFVNNSADGKTNVDFYVLNLRNDAQETELHANYAYQMEKQGEKITENAKITAKANMGGGQMATLTVDVNEVTEMLQNALTSSTVTKIGVDMLGGDLLTIKVNTVADNTQLPSIADRSAFHPARLNPTAFNEFLGEVENNALNALIGVMQLLPASVLMLLMQ